MSVVKAEVGHTVTLSHCATTVVVPIVFCFLLALDILWPECNDEHACHSTPVVRLPPPPLRALACMLGR